MRYHWRKETGGDEFPSLARPNCFYHDFDASFWLVVIKMLPMWLVVLKMLPISLQSPGWTCVWHIDDTLYIILRGAETSVRQPRQPVKCPIVSSSESSVSLCIWSRDTRVSPCVSDTHQSLIPYRKRYGMCRPLRLPPPPSPPRPLVVHLHHSFRFVWEDGANLSDVKCIVVK